MLKIKYSERYIFVNLLFSYTLVLKVDPIPSVVIASQYVVTKRLLLTSSGWFSSNTIEAPQ